MKFLSLLLFGLIILSDPSILIIRSSNLFWPDNNKSSLRSIDFDLMWRLLDIDGSGDDRNEGCADGWGCADGRSNSCADAQEIWLLSSSRNFQ